MFNKLTQQFSMVLSLVLAIMAGRAQAIEVVTPTSITLDTGSQFYPIGNLVNDSGLSGAVTTSNLQTVTHGGSSNTTAWVTDAFFPNYYSGGGPVPVVTLDLGGTYALTNAVTWNYSVPGNATRTVTAEFSTTGTGGTFSNPVTFQVGQPFAPAQSASLGTPTVANAVRLTFDANWVGVGAGGDRTGLGEIKFLGSSNAALENLSLGKTYSYSTLPTFSGGTFYIDDPHIQAPGAFSTGDLTDGAILPTGASVTSPAVNTLVGWGDPVNIATEIIVDLETLSDIDSIILGTNTLSANANGAPDDVTVSFSTTGTDPGDFSGDLLQAFAAPSGDGHHDLIIDVPDGTMAEFVKLSFDGGAVLTGNTANKWMLDELTIFGAQAAAVPEPASIAIWSVIGLVLAGFGWRCARRK